MRMWMVNPNILCNKHLLGEHGELHKFLPSFKKKYQVKNRINPIVQIQLSSYKERHDELALESLSGNMYAYPDWDPEIEDLESYKEALYNSLSYQFLYPLSLNAIFEPLPKIIVFCDEIKNDMSNIEQFFKIIG